MHIWKLLIVRVFSWLPLHGAVNSLMGPLHVALCGGWAWVHVPCHSFGCQVGAPFEETASDSFKDCGDSRATQRLMGELDAVGLRPDGMGKQSQVD